jgi:heme-degrading monooxygenase HmoA
MFIAMNRFRVKIGCEEAFEKVWKSRDSHLGGVAGFVEFHLLKGPEADDHTLYASHTVWQSRAAFEAWTRSFAFRAAHARAGRESTGSLYIEHPKFEGFEVRQTLRGAATGSPPSSP